VIDDPGRGLPLVDALAADPDYSAPTATGNLAMWAAYFGDARAALRLLEKSVHGSALLMHLAWLPVFEDVRRLPEFRELLIQIGLVDLWHTSGWPDVCRPTGGEDFVCA
jgi:hypothetical protein